MDKILVFDLEGTIAHFRKFYTNSSSLSYAFPPRTVITGLIAGILGYERDTYYDIFSSENCSIALSIRNPVRKLMQTVNYMRTKDIKEITGSGGHTQIPIEFVLPQIGQNSLKYRVYFLHKKEEIIENLKEKLKKGSFEYPPYLGLTECPAKVSLIDGEGEISLIMDLHNPIEIMTVVPIIKIESINFQEGHRYMKEEKLPVEFDNNRKIKKVSSYIYEQNCKFIKAIIKNDDFKSEIFHVKYKEKEKDIDEFGIFM
jgi:CRISPR-associated protein Cas5h